MHYLTVKKHPYLSITLAAAAILLISVVAFKRYLPYESAHLAPKQTPAIVIAMEDAHIVGMNHGKKAWSINAKEVQITRGRSVTTINKITDGKVYSGGKVAFNVTAGSAVYNDISRDLYLGGGITATGSDGQNVQARSASWNSSTSTLRSNEQVVFNNKWSKVNTNKLLVNVKDKQLEMWNVKLSFDLGEAEKRMEREVKQDAE